MKQASDRPHSSGTEETPIHVTAVAAVATVATVATATTIATTPHTIAYIALGANLGEPIATLLAAHSALAALPNTQLTASSSLYRTAPVGLKNQPDFINAVVAVHTQLNPSALLHALFAIETHFGRSRSIPNAARTLDLDLLLHGKTQQSQPQLTLPHPRMHTRAFVLAPLFEIAPHCHIPQQAALPDLLAACAKQTIERLPAHGPFPENIPKNAARPSQ